MDKNINNKLDKESYMGVGKKEYVVPEIVVIYYDLDILRTSISDGDNFWGDDLFGFENEGLLG